MVAIDEVLMCCCGILSAVVILYSSLFNWMVVSLIEGWFLSSVD